jgi:hypothetical protein
MVHLAIYQQRIPLRGSESSVNLFTEMLRGLKATNVCNSSADVLLESIRFWNNRSHTIKVTCTASTRFDGKSHAFYLQLLTSTEIQHKINNELDGLRRDQVLKVIMERDGSVARNEFVLEALIIILDLFKNSAAFATTVLSLVGTRSNESVVTNAGAAVVRSSVPRGEQRKYVERKLSSTNLSQAAAAAAADDNNSKQVSERMAGQAHTQTSLSQTHRPEDL